MDTYQTYKAVFESSPDAIVIVNLEGDILKVNLQAEKLFAYSSDEMVGRKIEILMPGHCRQAHVTQRQAYAENPSFRQMGSGLDIYARQKNGTEFPVEISLSPIKLSGQTIIAAAVRDISARKEMESKLLENEKRFRNLFDNMLEAVAIIGFDWHYLYVNDALAKQARYPVEKMLNQNITSLFPGIDQTEMFAAFKDTMQTRNVNNIDSPFVFPDNTTGWFRLSIQPVPEGIFILSVDITERKKSELLLLQSMQETKKINKELEQFTYMVSHDLQEPLRMVTGFLQLLQTETHEKLDETANEYIHYAVDGAGRMKTLITDLLEYSRIGTNAEDFSTIDLNELTRYVLQVCQATIEEKGAVIKTTTLPLIKGNRTLITQLLINLVGNALKYHGKGKPQIEIGAVNENNHYIFYVRDNGIGIEPRHFEKIFVIFQRLHTRQVYPGTGIGLAICKKIVEKHGGHIWVESQPGKGSTFYFSLPESLYIKDEV